MPSFDIENEFFNQNLIIAGIDEVGRGALAGPVCAAAVITQKEMEFPNNINDSKKLNSKQRNQVLLEINKLNIEYSFSFIYPEKIDKINILQATLLAMKESIFSLKTKPDFILIDGNYFKDYGINYKTIIKGDTISNSIALASIVAKVKRDELMINQYASEYPQYGFEKHKGYATKDHFKAIEKFGVLPIHRKSFLKNFFKRQLELFDLPKIIS